MIYFVSDSSCLHSAPRCTFPIDRIDITEAYMLNIWLLVDICKAYFQVMRKADELMRGNLIKWILSLLGFCQSCQAARQFPEEESASQFQVEQLWVLSIIFFLHIGNRSYSELPFGRIRHSIAFSVCWGDPFLPIFLDGMWGPLGGLQSVVWSACVRHHSCIWPSPLSS